MLRAVFSWGGIADIVVTATWCVLLFGLVNRGWSNNGTVQAMFWTVSALGIALALIEIVRRRRTRNTL